MQILDRVKINFFYFIIKDRFLFLGIKDKDRNYRILIADILFTAFRLTIFNTNIKILLKTLKIKILNGIYFKI